MVTMNGLGFGVGVFVFCLALLIVERAAG